MSSLLRARCLEHRTRALGMYMTIGLDGKLKISPGRVAVKYPKHIEELFCHREAIKTWLQVLAK